MKSILKLAGLLLAVYNTAQRSIECPEYLEDLLEESEMIARFQKDIESKQVTSIHHKYHLLHPSCPEFLMKHGFYAATEYLFREWFIKNKVDIVENVRASVNYLKKEIDRTFTLANNFKKKQKYLSVDQALPCVQVGPELYTHSHLCQVRPQVRQSRLSSHLGQEPHTHREPPQILRLWHSS